MHSTNECLDKAMFLASESYSSPVYEMSFGLLTDAPCGSALDFMLGYSEGDETQSAMALAA